MKKTNKGFSMVELIIVIAIMAILAGALAPTLIKYIARSRISADISTGDSIASSIQTALTNEAIDDATPSTFDEAYGSKETASGTSLGNELVKTLGDSASVVQKAKKAADGSKPGFDGKFYVIYNAGQVQVYAGNDGDEKYMVYPTQGEYFDLKNAN
ncbi:MAG: prepilin-type N-terminal cleavage/methylation domain-containing protein [Clostridiales bacterium]|nr:prepilin-type N-terminal cleavage/methylation domain-containing protein [Clostridiales bacterium]